MPYFTTHRDRSKRASRALVALPPPIKLRAAVYLRLAREAAFANIATVPMDFLDCSNLPFVQRTGQMRRLKGADGQHL